ncbi:MAG: efflux transporter outer membrane subunit, partial [Caulobacteraceae bacterium]
ARYEAPPGAALTPATLQRWWLVFGDPALDALEDQALRASPDARTARARVAEALGVRDAGIASTFPTGHIAGNATRQRASNIGGPSTSLFPIGGTTESETLNLNVSWELDLFGRLAQQRGVANADLAAALFDVDATWASLVAGVADNYFAAAGLAIQLADARESVRIESELERIAARKAAVGLGAASDADRVAGDLARARSDVEELESQLHNAKRQILILIGRGADPSDSLPIEARAADAPAPPAALPGDLLERRPDILEAAARLRAQRGTDRLAHLAIFPTFTLLPGLGLSRSVQPGVSFIPPATLIPAQQTTSLGFWSLGAGVSVPLLDIPRLLYQARAEDARTREALVAYEKTVQTAYGEAENALTALAAGERGVSVLREGEARARRASDAARRRFAMGLDDITAALSAEQAWRATRAAYTAERIVALRRAVQTYKALGGGWAFAAAGAPNA